MNEEMISFTSLSNDQMALIDIYLEEDRQFVVAKSIKPIEDNKYKIDFINKNCEELWKMQTAGDGWQRVVFDE